MHNTKGIDYYNKDNVDNVDNADNKDNEENKYYIAGEVPSPNNGKMAKASPASGFATAEEVAMPPVTPGGGVGSSPAILDKDQVLRCAVQFYDNGEQELQRYKLKLRLNLADNTNVEFIAALTQRLQNFKKHIPGPNAQELIDAAREYREEIFRNFAVYPFLGKFHRNLGRNSKRYRSVTAIEPNTMAVVWFDTKDDHWRYTVQIQNFVITGDLDETFVSAKQQQSGMLAKDLWCNPNGGDPHSIARPLTWQELRQKGEL